MTWLQPINDRDEITPEDFVKKLGGYLLESQSVVAYHGWIETRTTLLTMLSQLEHIISTIETRVKDLDQKGEIHWTEDVSDKPLQVQIATQAAYPQSFSSMAR